MLSPGRIIAGVAVLALGGLGWLVYAHERMPPGDWTGRCEREGSRAPLGRRTSSADLAWVTDPRQLLDAQAKAELTRSLEAFHSETCHQLAVVIAPSLEGQPIEEYSQAAANDLRLGYPRYNNGLLLLVALKDHVARIEVGCGLEDVVSDGAAAQIMSQQLIPAFRSGDYAGGIRAGVGELMALTRKKSIPAGYRPAGCR